MPFFRPGGLSTGGGVIDGDLTIKGDLEVQGNTDVGPITANSLFVNGNIDLPNAVALRARNAADTVWFDLIHLLGNNTVVVGFPVGQVRIGGGRLGFNTSGSLNIASREIVGIEDGTSLTYNALTGGTHNFAVNGVTSFTIKAGGFQYSIAAVPAENIDWNTATTHTKTISANTTFTMSNVAENQPIKVLVANSGTHTVDWTNPAGLTIEWDGGVVPVQTHNGKDLYLFERIGTVIIARVIQDIK